MEIMRPPGPRGFVARGRQAYQSTVPFAFHGVELPGLVRTNPCAGALGSSSLIAKPGEADGYAPADRASLLPLRLLA
jgi:hypothetical protein